MADEFDALFIGGNGHDRETMVRSIPYVRVPTTSAWVMPPVIPTSAWNEDGKGSRRPTGEYRLQRGERADGRPVYMWFPSD